MNILLVITCVIMCLLADGILIDSWNDAFDTFNNVSSILFDSLTIALYVITTIGYIQLGRSYKVEYNLGPIIVQLVLILLFLAQSIVVLID